MIFHMQYFVADLKGDMTFIICISVTMTMISRITKSIDLFKRTLPDVKGVYHCMVGPQTNGHG